MEKRLGVPGHIKRLMGRFERLKQMDLSEEELIEEFQGMRSHIDKIYEQIETELERNLIQTELINEINEVFPQILDIQPQISRRPRNSSAKRRPLPSGEPENIQPHQDLAILRGEEELEVLFQINREKLRRKTR